MNYPSPIHRLYLKIIGLLVLVITLCLGVATYYINHWPTDSWNPYIPTAARLFSLPFLSEMHFLPMTGILRVNMHGKETLILGIAIAQKLLNDTESLYPNVLLLVLCIGVSAILIYVIMRRLFNEHIGLIAFLLFITCFWMYQYMLQGAHPPLVLMNFLFSVFFLLRPQPKRMFYAFSGIFLGFMFFSSPTASVYLPYYLTAYLFKEYQEYKMKKKLLFSPRNALTVFLGASGVVLILTIPHPWLNIKELFHFVYVCKLANNFAVYQATMSDVFPFPDSLRGAGWIWILKYFFLIMPVMFPVYLLCLMYLTKQAFRNSALWIIIAASISTPLCVETIKVAQFGRNYNSWLVGIIFLICFSFYHFYSSIKISLWRRYKKFLLGCLVLFLAAHTAFNAWVFFGDVFPSSMATTYIHDWLINHQTNELYIYANHPRHMNMYCFLNNPKTENKIYFWSVQSIKEATRGYILVPPITGKTIWCECREEDFKDDPYLTELYNSGEFDKYVVAKFKTLSSSKFWSQEEEICTYRDLILKDITDQDRKKGYAWILDAEKLQREWFNKKFNENLKKQAK